MTEPYFKPWVGENYPSSNPKILVLGESHYGSGNEEMDFTQLVVRAWAKSEEGNRRFFTIVAKILSGKPYEWLSKEVKAAFWDNVIFYNYIQDIVGQGPRARPKDIMWSNAEIPFLHVLEKYSPDIVVVLGRELSTHIKSIKSLNKISAKFCYWSHPSSPKYFNKANSIADFNVIRDSLN